MSHEFVAHMLGTGRPKTTVLLNNFRSRGLLDTDRGVIRIRDHNRLTRMACECHGITEGLYAGLYQRVPPVQAPEET